VFLKERGMVVICMLMSDVKGRVNVYAARLSVFKVTDRNDPITDAYTGHV
jgi:hypothetical protein